MKFDLICSHVSAHSVSLFVYFMLSFILYVKCILYDLLHMFLCKIYFLVDVIHVFIYFSYVFMFLCCMFTTC